MNSDELLTIADLEPLGTAQLNPHATEANKMTREECKKHQIYHPNFDGFLTMTAYMYPTASAERLVCINVFMCFLFFIDDKYEHLMHYECFTYSDDLNRVLQVAVRILCENFKPAEESRIFPVCKYLYARFARFSSPLWMQRFKHSVSSHLEAATLGRNGKPTEVMSVNDYFAFRENDAGMYTAINCVEVAHGICLSDELLQHGTILELELLASRISWMGNDLFSYEKEVLCLGTKKNMVPVLMENNNFSFEEAVHEIISMINEDTRRFAELEKETLAYGDREIDDSIKSYVLGLRDIVIAMHYWQLSTNRYRSANSPFPELQSPL